jgi:homoserine dehydrogenase
MRCAWTADAAGPTLYCGAGAGRLATASAVVADIVDIARAGGRPVPGVGPPRAKRAIAVHAAWIESQCLVPAPRRRQDRPGVMSQLASCLGAEGISIEALIQKPPRKRRERTVPIVVLTDVAREDALRRAVAAIAALDSVGDRGRHTAYALRSTWPESVG